MTDKEIMELLTSGKSIWEQGQEFSKAFAAAAQKPSAFNIKPQVPRKKRQAKPASLTNGSSHTDEQPDNAH